MLNAGVLRQCCESQSVEDVLLESVFFGRYCEDVLLEYAVVGVTRLRMACSRPFLRSCCTIQFDRSTWRTYRHARSRLHLL